MFTTGDLLVVDDAGAVLEPSVGTVPVVRGRGHLARRTYWLLRRSVSFAAALEGYLGALRSSTFGASFTDVRRRARRRRRDRHHHDPHESPLRGCRCRDSSRADPSHDRVRKRDRL